MKRPMLLGYQVLTGLSDTMTGLLLIFAPAVTLRLMRLHVGAESLLLVSYIGVFVLSVGLACLYGAFLVTRVVFKQRLGVVWLLTGMTRGLVAVFLVVHILAGSMESGWATVAVTDGVFALFQGTGLAKGWFANAAE
jgi:hypothetical protein